MINVADTGMTSTKELTLGVEILFQLFLFSICACYLNKLSDLFVIRAYYTYM